jgi:hypothetical protein
LLATGSSGFSDGQSIDYFVLFQPPLTHEEWANGGWYDSLLGAPPPCPTGARYQPLELPPPGIANFWN